MTSKRLTLKRHLFCLSLVLAMTGCQTAPTHDAPAAHGSASAKSAPPASRSAPMLRELIGEYDNHSQRFADGSATASSIPVPALHQWLSTTQDVNAMLWRLRAGADDTAVEGRWLVREENGALVPYRPLTAAANGAFDGKAEYRFQSADWAPLAACALKHTANALAVDAGACSSLLPGLGSSAALLPQRVALAGDTMTLSTVSDVARGAGANTVSHRVRWFGGWDALNGGGPKAAANSKDWHLRHDLRLHSEGDRQPLRWRDGAESGYSLELARLTYKESNTEVLRLAVIEDATGRTLSYVWANPDATRIGLSLGWVQVGLDTDPAKATPKP